MPRTRKPKVGILTALSDFSPAYSLCGIILGQARMLQRAGYEYDLLTLKMFNEADKARASGLSVRHVLAHTHLHDYGANEPAKPDFEAQAEAHFVGNASGIGYREALEPYDVVIDHDLMFLSWHLPQNAAIRKCVDLWPEKRWLHWVHSAPSGRRDAVYPSTLRYQGCNNSTYVYLNHTQRQDVANTFQIGVQDVAVVHNPVDFRDFLGTGPDASLLMDRLRLLDQTILQVYPFSTPRWEAKGVKQLLKIFGAWRKMDIKARLVLVNAHCTQEVDEAQVRKMEEYAGEKCGLTPGVDVIWTSRLASEMAEECQADEKKWEAWKYSVPADVVRDLMLASNVFIFPSLSECCSLIQAEAALSGKLIVWNDDFAPMGEFVHRSAPHFSFTRNSPDLNPTYYDCVARELWSRMQHDGAFLTTADAKRKFYSRDWVWKNQLEPLLYRGRL